MCVHMHTHMHISSFNEKSHTIIHSEALTQRRVKQKGLLSYTVSNKPVHVLSFFIILCLFISIRLSQNAQSHSRLRRLGDHLFLSSTQPLFREFILSGSLFYLISFLSPTPLINLLTWYQSQGSWQHNNN